MNQPDDTPTTSPTRRAHPDQVASSAHEGDPCDEAPTRPRRGLSRRGALGIIGGGVGGAVLSGGIAGAASRGRRGDRSNGATAATETVGLDDDGLRAARELDTGQPDRFGRIFDADGFARPSDEVREALVELSRPGGILDANDPLEVGPIRLITEPGLSPDNPDNPNHTAGITFLGQFIDHDITRDVGSTLGRRTSLRRSMNLSSPRLDLDSVYGGGPTDSPQLFLDDDPARFRIESGGLFEDLPRTADGTAIVAESRNDENLIISGIQVAMLSFHNRVVEGLRRSDPSLDGDQAFAAARQLVRWHYQWIVLHEFLPAIVGADLVDDILTNGRRHFTDRRARIPVEFQTSTYRFGHSMVRPSYRANLAGDDGEPFFGFVFDADEMGDPDPDDLTGGRRAPRRFIGWQTFFDFDDGEVKPNKKIDTSISTPLFRLPAMTIDRGRNEPLGPTSLATRNLLRHLTWEIPAGQTIASAMGVERLAAADLDDFGQFGARLDERTPLWLYVLREAELIEDGERLGPVGGRITAEVLIGLLQEDPSSFLGAEPSWRPTLPGREAGRFEMVDLLTFAGVSPEQRGQ